MSYQAFDQLDFLWWLRPLLAGFCLMTLEYSFHGRVGQWFCDSIQFSTVKPGYLAKFFSLLVTTVTSSDTA